MGDADKLLPTNDSMRARLMLAASRHPLAARVARGLAIAGVGEHEPLLLLVSGGGDSLAMLLLVAAVRERTDATLGSLAVLSIDHGLRDESREECGVAMALARTLAIAQAEVVRVSVTRDGNLLHEARLARYDAALRHARALGMMAIAVAHQADDVAEGLVLALERGGGLDSVEELLPSRGVPDGPERVVRPLLRVTRGELRAFLAEVGVAWRDDPSNDTHARGALRTAPDTRALIERMARGAGRLAEEAGTLAAWRDGEVRRLLPEGTCEVAREALDRAPTPVVGALLRAIVHAGGGDIGRSALESAVAAVVGQDRSPRSYPCGDGLQLVVDARGVRVTAQGR
ncbi:MAG: tRNA lysidine(34) synthetase TilS [Planctomycetaceae bacterium]|nr:tRNA lysidine(34) synthetase TilS [Planctomycetaceae bacterium]